ncbi:hypothetical protein H4R18_003646 [Coemansia javaensis]|uniref:Cation-transporting P-type ATPase N-terminal domain-containing protein n=1 Tax=Coemansia javaensis TaxID=2761396 RepID=A0A9W8LHD3_9FUNG|nr:hypothetical protein H4R18_003646 [Coemansia javaensis]
MDEDRHLAYLSDLHRRVREWRPWTCTLAEVADRLGVDPSRGLDRLEARNRRAHFGANVPVDLGRQLGLGRVFVGEMSEPMMVLLLAVGVLYSLWGEAWDAVTIFATILAVIGLEVLTEWRARRALASLRNSVPANTSVLRGGMEGVVAADDLVLGDVITLCHGQVVPADAVVVVCHGFALDESALTGESDMIYKAALSGGHRRRSRRAGTAAAAAAAPASEDAPLLGMAPPLETTTTTTTTASSSSESHEALVYAGTRVASGRAVCIVVATGGLTEIGANIAALARAERPPPTPRQQQMRRLAGRLSVVALVLCAAIAGIALVQGVGWHGALLMGMSMAFATIPEELPLIAKASLAVGCRRLVQSGLLVRRASAADALASVSVIVTDKTGTLTRNQLVVSSILTVAGDGSELAIEVVTPEAAVASERSAALATPLYCAWALSVDPLEARPLARFLAAAERGRGSISGNSNDDTGTSGGGGGGFQPARGFGKDFMNTAVLQSLAADGELPRDPDTGAVPLGQIARAIADVCRRLPEPAGELAFDPTLRVSALTRSPPLPPEEEGEEQPQQQKRHWTVFKGAAEVLLPRCSRVWRAGGGSSNGNDNDNGNDDGSSDVTPAGIVVDLEPSFAQTLTRGAMDLAAGGSRVIVYAIAITDEPLYAPQTAGATAAGATAAGAAGAAAGARAGLEDRAFRFQAVTPTVVAAAAAASSLPAAAGAALPDGLVFVGAFAFYDPPQPAARAALRECQEAGVRVILATGDHPSTALAVAGAVGIAEAGEAHAVTGEMLQRGAADGTFGRLAGESNVFARMSPAQKLRLVRALQARGDVVAFIGDGINDAPALACADVGICMGGNPSTADVAMDAASLIVLSGDFGGVVRSLREGVRLDANMHKCLRYYLACKAALVLAVLLLLLGERAAPLSPVQVIAIELFADLGGTWSFLSQRPEAVGAPSLPSLPALRLAAAAAGLLGRRAGLLGRRAGLLGCGRRTDAAVLAHALALFAACTLPLLVPSLLLPRWAAAAVAPTLVFLTWMPAHALLGASMCTALVPLRRTYARARGFWTQTNAPAVVWLLCSALAVVAAAATPALGDHLGIVPLDAVEWAMVAAAPLLLFAGLELAKEARYRRVCRALARRDTLAAAP